MPSTDQQGDRFWLAHFWLPLGVFVLLYVVILIGNFDERIANALFYDSNARRWLGSGPGEWWARSLIHTGGRDLVRLIAVATILVWALSFRLPRLRGIRREAGYCALSIVAAISIVGGLKATTNVDCPWDLSLYGGARPHVTLFADRPDELPRAKCFPGAHSASAFAMLCFYFALRDRSRRASRLAFAGGAALGIIFAFGQQARGAHFISHDLTGAIIVWLVVAALYGWLLKPRPAKVGS